MPKTKSIRPGKHIHKSIVVAETNTGIPIQFCLSCKKFYFISELVINNNKFRQEIKVHNPDKLLIPKQLITPIKKGKKCHL